jgi:hypothetical protein
MHQPAEYARVVKDLASEKGEATLASGVTLNRRDDFGKDEGANRSLVQSLLAPLLMDYANGKS